MPVNASSPFDVIMVTNTFFNRGRFFHPVIIVQPLIHFWRIHVLVEPIGDFFQDAPYLIGSMFGFDTAGKLPDYRKIAAVIAAELLPDRNFHYSLHSRLNFLHQCPDFTVWWIVTGSQGFRHPRLI